MSQDKFREEFDKILTKIIFNEKRLGKLKSVVEKLGKGEIKVQDMKKEIALHIKKIYEEVSDLFPFYFKHLINSRVIIDFTNGTSKEQLEKELKEKNELLEAAATCIANIEKKIGMSAS